MKVITPPKANAIFAIFIVINVKIKVLNDFTYLVILKRIAAFINMRNVEKNITLDINSILLTSKTKKEIKIKILDKYKALAACLG